jgi:uncharacterized protein YndB with AHSA1/START domain
MNFSPADHLGAVTRTLTTTPRDDGDLRTLTVTRTYTAAPDEVWDALTAPDRLARWMGPVTGDLQVGGRYQVEGNAGGEILTCQRPSLLSVTWEYDGEVSSVDVTLQADDDGTRLVLEHRAVVPADFWERFGPGATGMGWELALMGLGEHLAAPEAPRPEPDDLPGLGDLMAASSDGWRAASVADGTDPEAARAAADRCLAFYTGAE